MVPNIKRYLNMTVFVSIPILFEDGNCRAFKLVGTEANGLWLQSDGLSHRLLPDDKQDLASMAPVVFVPFAQIAGVLVTTGASAQTRPSSQQLPESSTGGTTDHGSKLSPEMASVGQPKRKR